MTYFIDFSTKHVIFGGDKWDRTADLLNAIQALSRLVRLHTPLNRVKRALQYAGQKYMRLYKSVLVQTVKFSRI